jgi:hypothetical protein
MVLFDVKMAGTPTMQGLEYPYIMHSAGEMDLF